MYSHPIFSTSSSSGFWTIVILVLLGILILAAVFHIKKLNSFVLGQKYTSKEMDHFVELLVHYNTSKSFELEAIISLLTTYTLKYKHLGKLKYFLEHSQLDSERA
jgi:hypothetical protein